MSGNTKRGFNPVLAFILGFLLALVLTVGVVVGAALVALNYKLDKIGANKDSDGNYVYINADADNGGVSTVMDLVKKLSSMSKDFSSLTLGETEELLPIVGKLTDSLKDGLKDFVTLEDGELEAVKFGELADFIRGIIDKVDLVSLLDAPPTNNILVYMCLGVTGVRYDEEGGVWTAKYKDEEGGVHDCVIVLDENGKVESGYYLDAEDNKVALEGINTDNVKARANGVTKDLTLGEILKIDDGDRILGSVKNSTIDTLADDFNKLSIQQLFTDDIYALSEKEGDADVKRAVLWYRAVEETPQPATVYNEDYVYYTYDDGKYSLAGGWGKLKADEFDASKHYTLGEGKILFDKAFVYYVLADGEYVTVDGESGRGRVDALDGETYYTYGSPSPLWKLLLCVENDEKVKEEKVYAVNNITEMIENVTKNTQGTQMRELHAAGVLVFENPEELENRLVWYVGGVKNEKTIGDMALIEVITVMLYVSKNPTALLPVSP